MEDDRIDECIVPFQNRLFAHRASDGQNYCYGSNVAYQFTGDFQVVSTQLLTIFPYCCGYRIMQDLQLKDIPHLYATVSCCGKVYGHLNGLVFCFEGFRVRVIRVPSASEIPHNRLAVCNDRLYLAVNQTCYVFDDLDGNESLKQFFTVTQPDLRAYQIKDRLLFRCDSQNLLLYDNMLRGLSTASILFTRNLWYEGRSGDILYFVDYDTFVYYIIDCRVDICCYQLRANALIELEACWTGDQWQMSPKYIDQLMRMQQLNQYCAEPHVFRQINSGSIQSLDYQYASDFVFHRVAERNIAEHCFFANQFAEIEQLFARRPDVLPLFATEQFISWMLTQVVILRNEMAYKFFVQFAQFYVDPDQIMSTAFAAITRVSTEFTPFEVFPVEISCKFFFQATNSFIQEHGEQYLFQLQKAPFYVQLLAIKICVLIKHTGMFSALLKITDFSQLTSYEESPLHFCFKTQWNVGLSICMKDCQIQRFIAHPLPGQTPLMEAVLYGMDLEPFACQIGLRDESGRTALMFTKTVQQMHFLVHAEAGMKCNAGKTALMYHIQENTRLSDVEPLLIEAGQVDDKGFCALDHANIADALLIDELLKREHRVYRGLRCVRARIQLREKYYKDWHFRVLQRAFARSLNSLQWGFCDQDSAYRDTFGRGVSLQGYPIGTDVFGRNVTALANKFQINWEHKKQPSDKQQ